MARKAQSTQAPEKRDESTDTAVTEVATVSADTPNKTLEQMAGVADEPYVPADHTSDEPSTQQLDALDGLKQAKDEAKHPEKRGEDVNPHIAGPGSDIG